PHPQAVEIVGMQMTTDKMDDFSRGRIGMVGMGMTERAAKSVYEQAGLGPEDVQVIELHDCFSTNELITYEGLGLCKEGEGEKLVTYGQIAAMLGRPRAARAVGSALRKLAGPLSRVVPWHRVLNSAGRISFREDDWPDRQRELLEREGVRFRRGTVVDLERVR